MTGGTAYNVFRTNTITQIAKSAKLIIVVAGL